MASAQNAIPEDGPVRIALVGAGTIGLSFAALHLNENPQAQICIHDTRADLTEYVHSGLPKLLQNSRDGRNISEDWEKRVKITPSLADAVHDAHIVQEQGPENAPFKQALWEDVERLAPSTALFWSSTSGIPASLQATRLRDSTRLLVVHPYNPPHIMPLLEIVPGEGTAQWVLDATVGYWRSLGRAPVVMHRETTGFVANRLAFALLREAISLVQAGVIGVAELDSLVENSMGPRWAVAGPFKSYHAGGGDAGLAGFMRNIGGTVRDCWKASENIKVGPGGIEEGWEKNVSEEAEKAYGRVDLTERDRMTKAVLKTVKEEKEKVQDEEEKSDERKK